MNQEQQLVWKALALVEEGELVAMLRLLKEHPDRNATIEKVNEGLDKGLSIMEVFGDEYEGLYDLQYEGLLELDVDMPRPDLVCFSIGYSGALGEVAEFRFSFDADGRISQVEFESSRNSWLNYGFFDDTPRMS